MRVRCSRVLIALFVAIGASAVSAQNLTTNTVQLGGVAIDIGFGTVNSGTQRVIEASDSPVATGLGVETDAAATAGSTGSINAKLRLMTTDIDAIKTSVQTLDNAISGAGFNISQIGGASPTASACDDPAKVAFKNIAVSSSGNNEIVAISGSTVVYVCGFTLIADGAATDVQWINGTGTACGTGETDMATFPFDSTNGFGVAYSGGGGVVFKTDAGDALCLELSGANTINGFLSYVQQ